MLRPSPRPLVANLRAVVVSKGVPVPLIKPRPNHVRSVRHISRLREPNRDALVLYARFIGDTADYVLNQLIETTIAKDRDFITWRAESPGVASATPERRPTATTGEAQTEDER
jgi:hypothetical protein